MNHAIIKYGAFEKFVETTGGKKLNRSQIVESAKKYLKKEGMLDEVSVRLSDDILSRACMTRFRGQPTLQVRTNEIREFWMEGLLRHELGNIYGVFCLFQSSSTVSSSSSSSRSRSSSSNNNNNNNSRTPVVIQVHITYGAVTTGTRNGTSGAADVNSTYDLSTQQKRE